MFVYVLAALALVLALALFAMAQRHKTLLDPAVEREFQDRLRSLAADSRGRWGRMTAGQMLRHVAGALRMATGDLAIPPRRTPLRLFPIKQLVVFVLPFPRSAPTAPSLVVKEAVDFDEERRAVAELLASFASRTPPAWPDHPAFGPLNRDQWGVLAWKHVDHHFRQFGV